MLLKLTELFQSGFHFAEDAHAALPQGDVLVQFDSERTGRRLVFLFQLFFCVVE